MPWSEMYYLRNRITHDYFEVDVEIIWDIAVNYLPENKKQIKKILENGSQ
ncbi:MAG: HepT-like ribonuclease domain-containing protein [Melioribacteraceae bacterium]|nr:HepT-like ribonuclease domain-containing protein [Melioribacteraceae bacterium]